MGRRRKGTLPSYRLHKQSGDAIVSLPLGDGIYKDYKLGPYGSEESKSEYSRIVVEWQTHGMQAPGESRSPDTTINELAWKFYLHAEHYYRRPDGTQTNEVGEYKATLKLLRELYGGTPCRDFGPMQLKTVRERMILQGWCRTLINKRISRLKLVFRWGAENKLVPVRINDSGDSNYLQMLAVKYLKAGRSNARESEQVLPVSLAIVGATLPHMPPTVAAMIQVQLLTGAGPGEVCRMRGGDLDMTDSVWLYHPGRDQGPHGQHKYAWRGQRRVICIGSKAQEIIRPFLKTDQQAYLFSPAESRQQFDAQRRLNRKSPMTPSQAKRRQKKNPKRKPGAFYPPSSYCGAIYRAVDLANKVNPSANISHWHPNQLRHTRATDIANKYGKEVAQAILGHASIQTTEIYAEPNNPAGAKLMAEIG